MRFSTLSSTLLVFVLVAFAFVNAESYYNIDTNNLIRRAEEETHGHGGSASSSAIMAESTEATSSSHGKGGGATTSAAAEATTSAAASGHGHGGGGNNKAAQYGNFASPSILQGGSLFYIGISVTTLLWVTGKVIDVKTERQERYAERIAHQM